MSIDKYEQIENMNKNSISIIEIDKKYRLFIPSHVNITSTWKNLPEFMKPQYVENQNVFGNKFN